MVLNFTIFDAIHSCTVISAQGPFALRLMLNTDMHNKQVVLPSEVSTLALDHRFGQVLTIDIHLHIIFNDWCIEFWPIVTIWYMHIDKDGTRSQYISWYTIPVLLGMLDGIVTLAPPRPRRCGTTRSLPGCPMGWTWQGSSWEGVGWHITFQQLTTLSMKWCL